MKSIFWTPLLFIAVAVCGCMKSPGDADGSESSETVRNMITTTQYVVPVREGYTTNVFYKGALVASTSKTMTILLPKEVGTKATDNVEVCYQPGTTLHSTSTLWQTVIFEDSKTGDFDYNDLIFQARYQLNDNLLNIAVHPIALGSSKDIALGFTWQQGEKSGTQMIVNNCRQELFGSLSGFINTTATYNKHYDDLVKSVDVTVGAPSEAVNVWWFIVVDGTTRIFAVNSINAECTDANGYPYGFMLTDCRPQQVAKSSKADAVEYDETLWNSTIVPGSSFAWASMSESAPSIPSTAKNISEYKTWGTSNMINLIPSGTAYNGDLKFVKGFELYVQGSLTLSNFWGSNGFIYVMPGGKLIIPSGTNVSGVTILNYGIVELGREVVFNGATFKSVGSLDATGTSLTLGANGQFHVQNDLVIDNFQTNGTGSLHVGGLVVNQKANMSNNGSLFVRNGMQVAVLELVNNITAYVGCQLHVTTKLTVTNNVSLSVKGYLETPLLDGSNGFAINLMNGAVMAADDMTIGNVGAAKINIIGSAYGVLKTDALHLSGGLNISKTFNGNMYVNYGQLYEANSPIDLSNSRISLPAATVKFNAPDAQLAASACSPGYAASSGTETMTWFAYPQEHVNIATCYNFASWLKGSFDFTLLNGAKVFDIENSAPVQGAQMKVYEVAK